MHILKICGARGMGKKRWKLYTFHIPKSGILFLNPSLRLREGFKGFIKL